MPPVLSKLPVMISEEDVIDKRYENGVIYMLRNKYDLENKYVYIGSTINFNSRYSYHKWSCTNISSLAYNLKKYKYIRENGGWENWEMIKIENYPCKNKRELEKREDEIMLKYENRINHYRCIWTDENKKKSYNRYNYENRQKRNEYEKERYKNNKELISAKKKEKITCECGFISRKDKLNRHRKSIKHQEYLKKNLPII